MNELKTLKDLEFEKVFIREDDNMLIEKDGLKKAAIEWFHALDNKTWEDREFNDELDLDFASAITIRGWILDFFNLTEKEIQNET